MDLISILATVILVTTVGTMIIGVGAFAAFKLRDKRKPSKSKTDATLNLTGLEEPVFLKAYIPPALTEASFKSE
jgi:hypothetical protein